MQTPLSRSIERILFRRYLEKRLEGCTVETADEIALLVEPVTQPMFHIEGAQSGRIQSSEPNFTEQDKEETKWLSSHDLEQRKQWEEHAPNAFRQPDQEVLLMIKEIEGYRRVDKWLADEQNAAQQAGGRLPLDHLPEGSC